ncbi:MAG: flagellar hook-associated protein FlgL [Planctomycetota bacterium]|jgi:flagellar hook-associated protein 3 FlgL
MSGLLGNVYNNASFALFNHSKEIARLQEQASTGSRVNRPSDDPGAAYNILGFKTEQGSLENYIETLSDAQNTLIASTASIDAMKTSITSLIGIISGVTGTSSQNNILLEGVDNALEELVMWANSDYQGQYLFSGGDSATQPYTVERNGDGRITSVTYQGSDIERKVEVAPGMWTTTFYSGEDIFLSDDRSAAIFSGTTGVAAGTGTSSVTGDVFLTVTGSPGNYDLSIDGGLTAVNTDGTDTNLAVTDSRTGQVLYVDTTGITNTGQEWVRVPGTYDIFNTLIAIRNQIESGGDIEELRSNALESLDEIYNLLVRKGVTIGFKIGMMDDLNSNLSDLKFNVEENMAQLEQADIAQLAIDLSRRDVLYQMSLSVTAKLLSLSLLDFIR